VARRSAPLDSSFSATVAESRLASGGVYRLVKLSEKDRIEALKSRAHLKGFELNDQVLHFIITHYRRDTVSLFSLLDRIDNMSLIEQRKITVPFIKSLL
jgi:DnaA family protein